MMLLLLQNFKNEKLGNTCEPQSSTKYSFNIRVTMHVRTSVKKQSLKLLGLGLHRSKTMKSTDCQFKRDFQTASFYETGQNIHSIEINARAGEITLTVAIIKTQK